AEGRIKDITKWLNEHIHQYGSTRKPKEVIQAVCGREVSAEPILKYFTDKYTKIYNL
ncbi:MAG: carboxypeptidase M32, partial [Lachnospiraceae bacterium]|nr:carboxypeptidase M32 [Lachnospiraceae bacterium]